jgi:AcrR family transcriptional regulator
MARKPQTDIVTRVVEATMALAAERGWDAIELADIASRAEIGLAELRDVTPSKGAILGHFVRIIDKQVLAAVTGDLAGEPVKDRVFDVMMKRIDALAPYKEAMRSITAALRRDPFAAAAFNGVAVNSQRYMLAAAGVETEDALGALKVQGAVITFARVLDVWFDDDSTDLSKTMAALDRELVRGGRVLSFAADVHRLTAPMRAFCRALAESGQRFRERARTPRSAGKPDDGVVSV